MDERAKKCLDTIGEAFKTLIISANNEAELTGLAIEVLGEFQNTYEKAIDEGIEELEKRENGGK
jgi:hypothetical protein